VPTLILGIALRHKEQFRHVLLKSLVFEIQGPHHFGALPVGIRLQDLDLLGWLVALHVFQCLVILQDDIVSGSDQVISSFSLGASSVIDRGNFLNVSVEMGLTEEATDYSLNIAYIKRFSGIFSSK